MTNAEKIVKYTKTFNPNIVKIYMTKQAGLYIKHNVNPIDYFYNEGTLVFVFDKAETNAIYTKWLNRELS